MKQIKELSIIVVEDNLFNQQLIAKQLESISSAIHIFTNGEDCLEHLSSCNADLIVLDNNLGGMMNGLETLKLIRVVQPNIHVILFSTEIELDTEENLIAYGSFEYIEKNGSGFKKLKDRILKSEVYLQDARFNA